MSRPSSSSPSRCAARAGSIATAPLRVPHAARLLLALALALPAYAEGFTRPAAETFSGKQALSDALLRLGVDPREARPACDTLGISQDTLVTYWQWSAPADTAPPSIEFHLDTGARLVLEHPGGRLLAYVRHGNYWVAPGPPEQHAPAAPQSREAALPEADAAAQAAAWRDKLAPGGTWKASPPVYADRFDASPGDLYGAWWECAFERTHEGRAVRAAGIEIALDAATGQLMRVAVAPFTPPEASAVYFTPEHARLKADDFLRTVPDPLAELLVVKIDAPTQQIDDIGGQFAVRGGLDAPNAPRKARREARRREKTPENGTDPLAALPSIAPVPPVLADAPPELVYAPVREVWKQQTWQAIEAERPGMRLLLVYEFPTQTPTAPTLPVYVTAAGNEVVR